MNTNIPRFLVVDDDLGVIAAYRMVLEDAADVLPGSDPYGLDAAEQELFNQLAVGTTAPLWKIDYVDQGNDAIEAVKRSLADGNPYTVIFLDLQMPPGLDGYDTAERIRAIDPNVQLVFVSAHSDVMEDVLLEIGGGEGLVTILPKPVRPQDLRYVATVLSRAA